MKVVGLLWVSRGAGSVERLLTLDETADSLRVSVRTVQRLIAAGQLRPIRIGRRTLITEGEIRTYLSAAYRRAA